MQTARHTNVVTRPDTMLGVCETIGRDTGIHPNILRLAFGFAVLWNFEYAVMAYFGLGAVALLSHIAFPNGRRFWQRAKAVEAPVAVLPAPANETQALPLAA